MGRPVDLKRVSVLADCVRFQSWPLHLDGRDYVLHYRDLPEEVRELIGSIPEILALLHVKGHRQ